MNHVYNDLDANGDVYEDMITQAYWPYNWLENILNRFDEAYAALEPLRERDQERYALIHDRILLETLQFRYIKLSLYYAEYDERELLSTRQAFKYYCERLGIEYIALSKYVKTLWREWDIQ
jgi:hypothetical protein